MSNLNEQIKKNTTMNDSQKKFSFQNYLKNIDNKKPIIFITEKKPSENFK